MRRSAEGCGAGVTLRDDSSFGGTPRAAVRAAVSAAGGCDLCNLPVKALASSISRCRPQELCESRGDRPGLPVCNKPDGFRERKAKFEEDLTVSDSS